MKKEKKNANLFNQSNQSENQNTLLIDLILW